MDENTTSIEQRVRVLQIITGAMALGALVFALIGIFLVTQRGGMDDDTGMIMAIIGAVAAAIQLVLTQIAPGIAARQAASSSSDADRLPNQYQARHIITIALIEGAIFFNVICYIVGGYWWTLAIVGGLWLWLWLQFPTVTRVRQWLETQQMHAQ